MAWARTELFHIIYISLCVSLLGACGEPDPLSTLPQGERGRVVRIIDGDALVLDTGLSVRLVGLEAPAPKRRTRPGQPYAEQSARLIEDLVLGRQVRLIYPGITRDRYDRALAYVVTDDKLGPDLWLNHELLERGAARARFYPDTSALGERLLAAEAQARTAEAGLWALPAYDILPASDLSEDVQGFYIITAKLGPMAVDNEERAICSRGLIGAALRLRVERGAASLCRDDAHSSPVRLRGYVRNGVMEITHHLNVEILNRDASGQHASWK